MAKIIINPTSSSKREVPLARTIVSIGRDPSNDVILPDAMVSRRHAVIEYRGNQYFLRDCNSSNGSVVNGDRVSERGLRDGDLVAIGTARLLFREELELEEPGAKVVPHPSVPHLHCPSCQSEYRRGDLFCRECGVQLEKPSGPPKAVCASCGTAVPLPAKFCNACGTRLPEETGKAGIPDALAVPKPAEEDARPEPDKEASPSPAAPPAVDGEVALRAPDVLPPDDASTVPDPPRAGRRPVFDSRPSAALLAESPLVQHPAPEGPAPAAVPARPAWRAGSESGARSLREAEKRPDVRDEPAGFATRLLAGALDMGLVGAGLALVLAPVFYYWWTREIPRSAADIPFLPIFLSSVLVPLAAALGFAYFAWFWGVKGATPGQRLFDLVVEGEDGRFPIGFSRGIARTFGCVLSTLPLGIGFLMILGNGQGLHDKIAATRVVVRRRRV
jgi:pSer/pThr/pTyr-binding forkhead associated (FHA) protein/uncharacterized RDD family membrane protein YckC